MSDLKISLPLNPTPLIRRAADLLRRGLEERGARINPACQLRLELDPALGPEGFRLTTLPGGVRIAGRDERGVLYGVGKFLRHVQTEGERVLGSDWTGESVPAKPVRGMYFASHFHNVYHDAPLDLVVRYVEDLALWGCNALSVWFDMHHYQGIDDPAAQAMIARLRAILQAAEAVGMRSALTTLANEGFADTPAALKADWTSGHDGYFRDPGGHYHCEICPSKPGGLELILHERQQVFDAFRDLNLGFVWLWPYDQGGCTCRDCAPWGTNGFLRTCEAIIPLVHQYFPQAKTVLSTWYFDRFVKGEWEGLAQRFAGAPPAGVDVLMIDDFGGFPEYPLQHGVPGGLPVVGFPEISMEGNGPWGGFGANPRPQHWGTYWGKVKHLLQGSFPYSEGIYEDLNKVLILQLEWAPERAVDDIVREYATGAFGPAAAEPVLQAVRWLEGDGALHTGYAPGGPTFRTGALAHAGESLVVLEALAATLPSRILTSWRWRLLWLRAAITAELKQSGGAMTDRLDGYFEELASIYHAGQAERAVCPPSRQACRRLLGDTARHGSVAALKLRHQDPDVAEAPGGGRRSVLLSPCR